MINKILLLSCNKKIVSKNETSYVKVKEKSNGNDQVKIL